ncbi:hypothetical protein OIPHN260_29040 [Enterobacter roggenkampii]|uniref:Uncharacterized protein n=1 Tax=Enterobacter roggenkampii TaxID=1812935 RepID=A0AAU9C6Z1_9ENTR|nr:hypothetical protein OIPHN260_29040 [Enterobacter roggenkampii]
MTEGPLNESEMAWLEETLMSYGHDDASVLDVSELDGMFTAGFPVLLSLSQIPGWWRCGVARNTFRAGKTIAR